MWVESVCMGIYGKWDEILETGTQIGMLLPDEWFCFNWQLREQ